MRALRWAQADKDIQIKQPYKDIQIKYPNRNIQIKTSIWRHPKDIQPVTFNKPSPPTTWLLTLVCILTAINPHLTADTGSFYLTHSSSHRQLYSRVWNPKATLCRSQRESSFCKHTKEIQDRIGRIHRLHCRDWLFISYKYLVDGWRASGRAGKRAPFLFSPFARSSLFIKSILVSRAL